MNVDHIIAHFAIQALKFCCMFSIILSSSISFILYNSNNLILKTFDIVRKLLKNI